ncbi:MAG: hypothetical protein ACRDL7_04890, partial [Gaiellaceae bacterium]
RALYQAPVDAVNAELSPFEKIKAFALLPRELSADAGELTPTFKIRRRIVSERFRDVIEDMYAHAHAPQGTAVRASA